ncbi:MAG: DUF547 domain-containing protein [Bacteroidota bacterium]
MKTRAVQIALLILMVFQFGFAQSTQEFFDKADVFFKTYIKDGRITYAAIKEDESTLNELIEMAKIITVSKDAPEIYQAFWINGYNLSVIKGIIDNYPIKSPLDRPGFFDTTIYDIGRMSITLNAIENKLLRANFPKEARFHFVLVCAGLGCPPIIDRAYLPSTLETQLQQQTELSLNDPNFIKVKGNSVKLSQIFEWYKGDFARDGNNEIEFINRFRKEKLDIGAKVGYYPYDWRLNDTK